MLRRVTLLSVLAFSGALLGAAPALAQSVLKLSSGQPIQTLQPAQPALAPSPAQLEFGAVDVHFGGSPRQSVMFSSPSQSPVAISSVSIVEKDGSSFQIVGDSCSGQTIELGGCTVEVAFDPGAPVGRNATLEVLTEEGESFEVPLSGEGITGTLSASESPLSFSAIPYTGSSSRGEGGQNETDEVTISGSATASTQLEAVRITGADASSFSVQWGNCERNLLGPNNTCTMGIRFEPNSLGANHAQLEITSDSSSNPLVIPLEGAGLSGPKISMSSTQALLGEVSMGSAAWQTFTLTNTGDYPLGVQQAFLVSGTPLMFPVLSDTCSGQLVKPGDSCVVTVGFQPTTPGEKDASILLITNSSLPVEVVGIDGVGVGAQAAAAPQAVPPAAATSFSVTLTSPPPPVPQGSAAPSHLPAKVAAHSRCKRRKTCQRKAQQVAAAHHRRRIAVVRLRQQR